MFHVNSLSRVTFGRRCKKSFLAGALVHPSSMLRSSETHPILRSSSGLVEKTGRTVLNELANGHEFVQWS